MREKIARIIYKEIPTGTAFEKKDNIATQVLTLIRAEIKPELEVIDGLVSDIEGDWTDPRYECEKISEKIQAILKALEAE